MHGLLERALHLNPSSNAWPHSGTPSDGTNGEDGISAAERGELAAEIDRLFTDRSLIREAAGPSDAKRRSGVALPIAVNLIAALIIAAGILVSHNLLAFVAPATKAAAGSFTTTEGLLVQRVREQASAQLSARQQQIAAIERELAGLKSGSPSLGASQLGAAQTRERTLERELASLQSNASSRLADLATAREHDLFLIRQLRSIYQDVQSQISANRLGAALNGVAAADRIVAMAGQGEDKEMAALLPGLQAGNEVLRVAIVYGQSVLRTAGSSQELAARVADLERTIATLRSSLNEQSQTIERYRVRLNSQNATSAEQARLIAEQSRELRKRADQLAAVVGSLQRGVHDLRTHLDAPAGGESPSARQAGIVDLLGTKVTLREAVSSEAVRSKYPGLSANLDSFFKQYGDVYAREGRLSALKEVAAVFGAAVAALEQQTAVGKPSPAADAAGLPSRGVLTASDEPVSAYLAKLDNLLAAMLRRLN